MELKGYQRSYLFRLAHHIDPVVLIGSGGLSPGVMEAIEQALGHHELIKVRFLDHKDARESLAAGIAENLHAVLVRITGNTAVFYRRARLPERRKIRIPEKPKTGGDE